MRILGIEPALPKPHYLSNIHLVRVGLPSLLTDLRNKGHQVTLLMEEIDFPDEDGLLKEAEKADLVAISTLSATHPRGQELAELISCELGIPVAFGGPHVTFSDPEEAMGDADYLIRHEAEFAFPLLVEALEEKRDLKDVPNLTYLDPNGEIVENPVAKELPNINDFPFPDFSLIRGWRNSFMMPMETARGCPYNCTFCCVHKMFPKVRFRDPESVVEEIKKTNPRSVFFCDDNFAIDIDRSKEILSLMLQKMDRIPRWGAQVRASVAKDEEWLRLAKRTGCQFLCIGLESVNAESLKEMHKRQTLEEIEECMAAFRERRMIQAIHGSFVVGFDSDDKKTAMETADWARSQGIHSIQIWVLAPLPGTEFRAALENQNRLLSSDPRDCDGTRATFIPAKMTAAELQDSAFAGMRKFYSLQNRLAALARGIAGITKDYVMQFSSNKELWRENFKETVVKWYGRKIVKNIEKRAREYLAKLKS